MMSGLLVSIKIRGTLGSQQYTVAICLSKALVAAQFSSFSSEEVITLQTWAAESRLS